MDYDSLAQWVAIAITMSLSILVPLFTQIANNRFQYKKSIQEYEFAKADEQQRKRIAAYENFLMNVGAAIEFCDSSSLRAAGSSIGQIYLYVPKDLHAKLDILFNSIRKNEWGNAETQYLELAKLICEKELNH